MKDCIGAGNRKSPEGVQSRAQLWRSGPLSSHRASSRAVLPTPFFPAINVMRPRRSSEIALRLRKFFTVSSVSMAQLLADITRGHVTGVGGTPWVRSEFQMVHRLTDRICLRQGEGDRSARWAWQVSRVGGPDGVRAAPSCCGAGPFPCGVLDDGARLPPVSRIVPPFSHRLTTTTSACNRSSRGRPGVYLCVSMRGLVEKGACSLPPRPLYCAAAVGQRSSVRYGSPLAAGGVPKRRPPMTNPV